MRKCRFGLAALLAIHVPAIPDGAEGACRVGDAVVFARREDSGLQWYMARRGHRTLDLGWGYEGEPVCAGAVDRGRYLVAWGFFDPWGGSPEIHTVAVDGDRVVARHDHRAWCPDAQPVAPRRGGWLLRWRCGEDGAIEERELDRDGF